MRLGIQTYEGGVGPAYEKLGWEVRCTQPPGLQAHQVKARRGPSRVALTMEDGWGMGG